MAKYITSTNKFSTITVKGINPDTEEISERSKTIFGEPTDTDCRIAMYSPAFMPLKVLSINTKEEKRRMTFEQWLLYSKPITEENKKEKGRFILRTMKHTVTLLKWLNVRTEDIFTKEVKLQGDLEPFEALAETKCLYNFTEEIPFKVLECTTKEEKRRISFDDWMKYSEPCGEETPDSE